MKINFWLIPGADTGNQKGFRILRDATQGNGARVLGPWPNELATALRENAPQGSFRIPQGSRKAGESFISHTRFIRAQRENKDSDLRALGGIPYNSALMANQMTGTARDGSILSVLQSRMFSIDKPDAAMRIPPMIDTSVIRASVKNPDNAPAHK